jgi:hypothetical protein
MLVAVAGMLLAPALAVGADRAALERDARGVVQMLTATVPTAKSLSKYAVAVLVFPKTTKAGLVGGGQYGGGFEVGVGPSIVVVDQGKGKGLTSKTAKDDVHAFIFSQKGLMAVLGPQGSNRLKD